MKRRQLNPELTRQRLLKAATAEFSRKGLQGARVVTIARQAGTNLQAIYYHFGSKEGLYGAALDRIYDTKRFEDAYRTLDELEPREAILYVIGFMFEAYSRHPENRTLLAEEDRYGARHLKALPRVQALFRKFIDKIDGVLKRGAAAGVFQPGLDAARVYLSITSLTGSYLHKVHTHSALLGRDFGSPDEVDAWRTHIAGLILAGLNAPRPQPPEEPAPSGRVRGSTDSRRAVAAARKADGLVE